MTTAADPATVEKCLSLGHGFHPDERPSVVTLLHKLDAHLADEPAEGVRLELHQKEPGQRGRRVVLECHVDGLPTLISHSEKEEIHEAIADTRDEMVRQLDDRKSKRIARTRD